MTLMDYKKIGLKCGIEIHQQLEGKKLFCGCPTRLRDDPPHFLIRRKLRASAGESGEVDIAAQQEHARDRVFCYQGYLDTTCLVEADEEPPHEINPASLFTARQFCKMVKADISSIIQVMRKTVVDGSNTSGFQRTALIARKGKIETAQGEVRIANVSLEEDAAKIVSEQGPEKTYLLDRLGIPLIEIGTMPDIATPEQCQETAKKLGMILRSLPGIKRGLGTIRQDVNVSVADGTRIEIKGAQDLKQLSRLVELEVKRQLELLAIRSELKGTRLNKFAVIDLSTAMQSSPSKIIQKCFETKGKVLGIRLHNFAGFVGRELQPVYRLGTEFSGRAKIIAGVGGIFHSDELPGYGIEKEDLAKIRKKMRCSVPDAFILVAEDEKKALLALEAVHTRAAEVLLGIPQEVRKANPDGTTSFLRPMPGSARMYPETDVPLIRTSMEDIPLPELLEEKIRRFQEIFQLSGDLASFIARSNWADIFEEMVKAYPSVKPAFIADTLISMPLEIKRKYGLDPEQLTESDFKEAFRYLEEKKIHKDIMLDVLIDMIKGTFDISKYASLGTEHIHLVLKEIIAGNKGAPFPALMGLAVKALAGKASGKFIADELKKILPKD